MNGVILRTALAVTVIVLAFPATNFGRATVGASSGDTKPLRRLAASLQAAPRPGLPVWIVLFVGLTLIAIGRMLYRRRMPTPSY